MHHYLHEEIDVLFSVLSGFSTMEPHLRDFLVPLNAGRFFGQFEADGLYPIIMRQEHGSFRGRLRKNVSHRSACAYYFCSIEILLAFSTKIADAGQAAQLHLIDLAQT